MTIYFVSAGIGGVEYLTLQAQDILTKAQVILYDASVQFPVVFYQPMHRKLK